MSISDKIEIIRDLIAQRDEIERQIAELIGGDASKPHTVRDRKPDAKPAKTGGRKRSSCSICGKPGHNVMTCPQGRGMHPNNPRPAATSEKGEQLSEDQFDELKHYQKIGELSSRDFASNRNLPLSEVNRAIACRNYAEYESGRDRTV